MAKLEVISYFIGFGNACLVLDYANNTAIIIDCGSKQFSFTWQSASYLVPIDTIIANITDLCNDIARLLAVVTHPHADHYSLLNDVVNSIAEAHRVSGHNIEIQLIIGGANGNITLPPRIRSRNSSRIYAYLNVTIALDPPRQCYSVVTNIEKYSLFQQAEQLDSEGKNAFSQYVNPTTTDEIKISVASFTKGALKICRCMGQLNSDEVSENSKGILLLYSFNGKNLLFMGDAPFNNDGWLCLLQMLRNNNVTEIIWYQIPHHGSDHHNEFLWTRHLIDSGITIRNAVLSTLSGVHIGIPNKFAFREYFGQSITGEGYFIIVTADDESKAEEVFYINEESAICLSCTQSVVLINNNPFATVLFSE